MVGRNPRYPLQQLRCRLRLLFGRLKFGHTVHGSQGVHESRDMPSQLDRRHLYLSHELQESSHQTISHRPLADAGHAPDKSDQIGNGEAERQETSGSRIVVQARDNPAGGVLLEQSQMRRGRPQATECQHQHAIHDTFLHITLYFRILRPDFGGQGTDGTEEEPARQRTEQHDSHKNPQKPGRKQEEHDRGCQQLAQGDEHIRDAGTDELGKHSGVLLQPVDRISAVTAFATAPDRAQRPGEQVQPQLLLHPDRHAALQIRGQHAASYLQQQGTCRQTDRRHERRIVGTGRNIDEPLAEPDERQRGGNVHPSEQSVKQHPPPIWPAERQKLTQAYGKRPHRFVYFILLRHSILYIHNMGLRRQRRRYQTRPRCKAVWSRHGISLPSGRITA